MIDNNVILENDFYVFKCPHCQQYVQVHKNEINCRIFRHAVYKNNMVPISPHASKDQCDNLVATDQVYGCAKPFMLSRNTDNDFVVEICGYI